jgi:putative glutamine amidotransferase
MTTKPLIAVPSDRRILDPHPSHVAGEKYLKALIDGAGGIPVIVPSMAGDIDIDEILDRVDGILLTGSYSNIEPHRYGGEITRYALWNEECPCWQFVGDIRN